MEITQLFNQRENKINKFWNICKIEYNAAVQMSKLELQISTRINLKHIMREKYSMIQLIHRFKTCKTKPYIYIYWYTYY